MPNLLFLDVNGVLICDRSANFNPELMGNLKHITDNINLEIIVSSSWRSREDLFGKLLEALERYEIPKPIGKTGKGPARANLINAYCYNYCKERHLEMSEIKFVNLDDNVHLKEMMPENTIMTESRIGLNREKADEVINLFKNE